MYKTGVSNCLISAVLAKLLHPIRNRIIMQRVPERFPHPPYFLWTDGKLVYDFLTDVDITPLRTWLPYTGHIRVRTLQAYKIYHPERTDL